MAERHTTDMSAFEKADGSLPRGKSSIARFLGQIVSAASVLPPEQLHASPVRCRRRPKRRPCGGYIELGRFRSGNDDDGGAEDEARGAREIVRYRCPKCGDAGAIDNWRDTRWDLGPEMKSGQVISLSLARAKRDAAPRTRVLTVTCDLIDGPIALDGPVMRRVRIGCDRTLHELHALICEAYERDADEPYEFMFGAPYEIDARRFTGIGEADDDDEPICETHHVRIGELGLEKQQSFGYLYDFDAEWVHRLTVLEAREEASCATVVERIGATPDVGDGEWIETLVWTDDDDLLDDDVSDCPMSDLYGPYDAEHAPDAEWWLAMEDLERLLLVLEAHGREEAEAELIGKVTEAAGISGSEQSSMLLHSIVHETAETALARGDAEMTARLAAMVADGKSRHEAIHALGHELVKAQL